MADKKYGFEDGYGSGSSVDVSNSTTPTYGYESGYGSQPQVNPQLEIAKTAINKVSQLAPWNRANQMLKNAGGEVAQAGGYVGGKVSSDGYPNAGDAIQATGIGVGGAIALSPEILAAYTGLKGIYNSPNPIVKGLVNTPQELGPQYAAQNQAIGISNDVPETASKVVNPDPYQYPSQLTKPKYIPVEQPGNPFLKTGEKIIEPVSNPGGQPFLRPKPQIPAETLPSTTPIKYPDDPGALINHINDRIGTHGINLNPQELSDYKNLLQTKMANGEIPRFDPTTGRTTSIFAKASQTASNVNDTLNQVSEPLLKNANLPEGAIPTRAGLNQAYGVSSKQQALTDFIKKYGVKGVELGLGSLGLKTAYDYLRK